MMRIKTTKGILNQTEAIKLRINELIDQGYTNKRDIYNEIEINMKVPRSTVRRIARQVREDLQKRLTALQTDSCISKIPHEVCD